MLTQDQKAISRIKGTIEFIETLTGDRQEAYKELFYDMITTIIKEEQV